MPLALLPRAGWNNRKHERGAYHMQLPFPLMRIVCATADLFELMNPFPSLQDLDHAFRKTCKDGCPGLLIGM